MPIWRTSLKKQRYSQDLIFRENELNMLYKKPLAHIGGVSKKVRLVGLVKMASECRILFVFNTIHTPYSHMC